MQMIGHETVGKNRKRLFATGTRNLRTYDVDAIALRQEAAALERAEGQEIAAETDVVEGFEMPGIASAHAARMAIRSPAKAGHYVLNPVRLKPDTTY